MKQVDIDLIENWEVPTWLVNVDQSCEFIEVEFTEISDIFVPKVGR